MSPTRLLAVSLHAALHAALLAGVNAVILAVLTAVLTAVLAAPATAQDLPQQVVDTAYVAGDYRVYSGAGEPATLKAVIAAMGRHDVVFIGETHDDPTAHWLEVELLKGAWEAYGGVPADGAPPRRLALSLEFFERDVQPILDEYLGDLITEPAFLAASRPWPRYATDYRPLIEFSRVNGVDVIASNAPRRYANRVTRYGRESLEDLPPQALAHLPPLPYGQPSPEYRDQWIQVISRVMRLEGTRCGVPVHHAPAPVGAHSEMGNQLHTQALWDASMAWWISRYLESRPRALVLHMAGGFHVARGTGTPEHLSAYRPGASHMIVMFRPVDDVGVFEPAPEGEWGDFVIQTERARTLEAIECRAFLAERTPDAR